MCTKKLSSIVLLALLVAGAILALSCSSPAAGDESSNTGRATLPAPSSTPTPPATETKPTSTASPLPSPSRTSAPPTPVPSATPTATIPPSHTPELPSGSTVVTYTYRVIDEYPHDIYAWTQGLSFQDDVLYEGTGQYGRSQLRKVDLATGEILQYRSLPDLFFGEGIAVFDNRIYQLTWQSHTGFVYDKNSFELLQTFSYPTWGWGLTHDGSRLIMSDGSAALYFLDPETLTKVGQIEVRDADGPVIMLNELEYIEGEIYANVWQTNRIARIDPGTGQVTGWIDLTGLLKPEDLGQQVDVLNGIAYDAVGDRLLVTGKLWPKIFEIELLPQEP